jgi:hypothetical protein
MSLEFTRSSGFQGIVATRKCHINRNETLPRTAQSEMQYPNFPVGYGRLSNGDTQAYVLTPCEENHGRGEGCGEGGGENVVLQTSPARG